MEMMDMLLAKKRSSDRRQWLKITVTAQKFNKGCSNLVASKELKGKTKNEKTTDLIIIAELVISAVMAKDILDKLTVADGFAISLFADDVENARQIAVSKEGIVYAGSRKQVMFMH